MQSRRQGHSALEEKEAGRNLQKILTAGKLRNKMFCPAPI